MSIPIKVRYMYGDIYISTSTIKSIMYHDIVNGKHGEDVERYIKDFVKRLEELRN